jgi:multidrug efflux system outer membrane protein
MCERKIKTDMRHNHNIIPVLLSAALVSACTVGSDYVRPTPDMPEQWRVSEAETQGNTLGSADALWWEQFNDPELNRLIAEALRENRDIRIAAARVDQYLGLLQTTRSAFFPQIGGAADASRAKSTESSASGFPVGAANPSNLYAAQFNLAWQIDFFGRTQRASEAARAQVLASEEGRRAVILSVTSGVASSYIALRAYDLKLAVAQASLKNYAETLRIFELRFQGGVISQLELAQVQSQYQLALATIPTIEQQVAVEENLLSTLIGHNPGSIVRGKSLTDLKYPGIPAGLPSTLLERRPDIMRAEAEMVAANAQVGVAKSLYFPTISLTGALGTASSSLSNLFSGPAGAWSMGANLAMPLATFGNIEGQVQSAEALYQQTALSYQQSVQIALREVNDALSGVQKSRDALSAQSRRVAALKDYAQLANLRFENGLTSYLEVLNAEDNLFSAQLNYADAQGLAYTQIINVYKAMGGGWVDKAADMTKVVTAKPSYRPR